MQLSVSLDSLKPLAFVLTIAAIGCGGGDDDDGNSTPDAGISPSCMEATTQSSLTWVQDNIFTTSCAAFGSCHMGQAAGADGLNLETGMTMAETVDIDSTRDSRYKLVAPGDADNSYLLMIMGRNPLQNDVMINRSMPLGNPNLCEEKQEAVARWINSL